MDWLIRKLDKLSDTLSWEVSGRRRTDETDTSACAVSASIGVALSKAGEDFDTLYQNADTALYSVKERGRNDWAVFGQK